MEETKLLFLCVLFLTSAGIVRSNDIVSCSSSSDCSVDLRNTTVDSCCNGVAENFSFILSAPLECIPCPPIRFGFNQTSFVNQECADPYALEVGFLRGSPVPNITTSFKIIVESTELSFGGRYIVNDLSFDNNSIFTIHPSNGPTALIYFKFNLDGVALEPNEHFTFKIVDISPQQLPGTVILSSEVNGTIVDSDEVSFGFRRHEYVIVEGESRSLEVEIFKTPGIRLATSVQLLVSALTEPEAVTAGISDFRGNVHPLMASAGDSDFSIGFPNAIFRADENLVYDGFSSIFVGISDDAIDEMNEEFFVLTLQHLLDTPMADRIHIIGNTSIGIIIDNDVCGITFGNTDATNAFSGSVSTYTVMEPSNGTWMNDTIHLIKTSNCTSEQTFYIGVSVGPGSLTGTAPAALDTSTDVNDYNIGGPGVGYRELIFPPDRQSIGFDFYLNSDYLFEGIEAFEVVISFSRFHASDFKANAFVVILDNDDVVVGMEPSRYYAREDSRSVVVCVVMTNPPRDQALLFNARLLVTSVQGTASTDDFEVGQIPVTLTDSIRRVCVGISLVNDNLPEYTESFEVVLSENLARTTNRLNYSFSPRVAAVVITDDDRQCSSTVRCYMSEDCSGSGITNGSEIECCNHALEPPGIAFECASDQRTCHACPVVFGFRNIEVNLPEQSEAYSFPVAFFWGAVSNATFSAAVIYQEADTRDVRLISEGPLFFPAGVLQQEVVFSIIPDSVSQEQNDRFVIRLSNRGTNFPSSSSLQLRLRVDIIDTDMVEFSIAAREYRVTEGMDVPIMISKSPGIKLATPVLLTVTPAKPRNVATDPNAPILADENDYNSTVHFVTFPADENLDSPINRVAAPISTTDDRVNEADQVFFIALSLRDATNASLVSVGLRRTNCYINNDDPFFLGFNRMELTAEEPGFRLGMFIGLLLSKGSSVSEQTFRSIITVDPSSTASVIDSNRTNDFSLGTLERLTLGINYPPEENLDAPVFITLYTDSLYEGPETIRLCHSPQASFPQYEITGSPCAEITLKDSQSIVMGFEQENYFVNESSGSVEVCVNMTRPALNEALLYTLTYRIQTVARSAGEDEFGDEVLGDFPPSQMNETKRSCANISIVDDQVFEDTETLLLKLSLNGTQQDLVRHEIFPNQTMVHIVDDDGPVIGFRMAEYSFAESSTNARIEFGVLSGALQVPIPIQLGVSDRSPSDFQSLTSGRHILDANNTMVVISFSVRNSADYEITEHIYLDLSFAGTPPDRAAINPDSAVINIVDESELLFQFGATEYSVDQGESSVNISVELLTGSLFDYSVALQATTLNASALAGVNFVQTSVNLQFDSSETEFPIEIALLYDPTTETKRFFMNLSFVSVSDADGKLVNTSEQELQRIRINTAANPVEISIIPISNHLITTPEPNQVGNSANSATAILAASLSSVAATIIVVLLVIAICVLYYRYRKKNKFDILSEIAHAKELGVGLMDKRVERNKVQSSFKLNIPKHLIISAKNLQMEETIGQGQYGVVYKGYLTKGFSQNYKELVAVKTLKGFFDKNLVRSLLEECSTMANFDHPNVLTLTGVCLDGGAAPYIVMPFMFNGSLLSYLMKNRESLSFSTDSEEEEKIAQASEKLTDICLQIAQGMEYLAGKRVIHRDLAARNCMVDMNFVIKVSDFGLSETINPSKNYFRQKESGVKLPFKWMSPESLDEGIFSEKSDIWAFGVTCWEVFSVGKSPYPGINPTDLSQMLHTGYRMEKPQNAACSATMYNLLLQCWELKPANRPHFNNLVSTIGRVLEISADYLVFTDTSTNVEPASHSFKAVEEHMTSQL